MMQKCRDCIHSWQDLEGLRCRELSSAHVGGTTSDLCSKIRAAWGMDDGRCSEYDTGELRAERVAAGTSQYVCV